MRSAAFLFKLVCSLAIAAPMAFATPLTSKVRSTLGDVTRFSDKTKKWDVLRVGNKVFPADTIKTALESEAILGMPDGSMLTVAELSLVALSELVEENGSFRTEIDVKSGRLSFAAQKQNKKSEFKFKTGIATASIRGTEGTIDGGDQFLAGLRNGALEIVTTDGQTIMITGGQVVFKKGESYTTMDLKSSGDPTFHKRLASLLADSTISLDSLFKKIRHDDSTYQAKLNEIQKSIVCEVNALPDTVRTSDILIKGKCPENSNATLYGEALTFDKEGNFIANITMDSTAVGDKRFQLTCAVKNFKFGCGEVSTYYKPETQIQKESFTITSPVPAVVCDEGLVVEGLYQTAEPTATLHITVGNTYRSANLIRITDGLPHQFTQVIAINDENGLWTENKATMEFRSQDIRDIREITFNVVKSCPMVNQKAPTVHLDKYDSLYCQAAVSVGNLKNDEAIYTTYIDGVNSKSKTLQKDASIKVAMAEGIHEYEFSAEDQAGNRGSVTKTLGCFPNKFFKVKVEGKNPEVLWFPPGPPKSHASLQKSLRFKIEDVKDVSDIHSVIVKQNGKQILKETGNQIQALDYDLTVNLKRNSPNKFEIQVIHKSGRMATAIKIFEVN